MLFLSAPTYTEYVIGQLRDITLKHGDNGDAILNEVTTKLIPDLKAMIQVAENQIRSNPSWAGKSLNDYFKFILDNSAIP